MPRNGSGTYTLPAGNPVVFGTIIDETVQNNTTSDIATALTGSVAADGQTTITANQSMSNFRHTSVGNASARTDYAAAGQVQDSSLQWLTTVAGTNTITAVAVPAITAYASGQSFRFIPAVSNTGAATINLNSVGAKDLKKNTGSGYAALVSGDLVAGNVYQIVYDDTGTDQFVVLNPGDIVTLTATQTLTNKTLTSPVINTGTVGTSLNPTSNDAAALGSASVSWSDLFLASGAVINFDNGNAVVTHSSGILTVSTGDLRVTTAGTNAASAVTVGGTQTLTNKTFSGGTISGTVAGSPTISGAWTFSANPTISGLTPSLDFTETDAAADNGRWRMRASTESFRHSVLTDAGTQADYCAIDRTGNTVDEVDWTVTSFRVNNVEVSLNSTTNTHTALGIELGHATDTTFTRPAAGRAQIEGREIVTAAADATTLTSTITELNKVDDSAAAISSYVSAVREYLHVNGAHATTFDVDANITEATFESIGPTSSGATNTWTAMDDMPTSATYAILKVEISFTTNVTTGSGADLYGRQTGSATGVTELTNLCGHEYEAVASGDVVVLHYSNLRVPLDSSRRMDITWAVFGESARLISLGLQGFGA